MWKKCKKVLKYISLTVILNHSFASLSLSQSRYLVFLSAPNLRARRLSTCSRPLTHTLSKSISKYYLSWNKGRERTRRVERDDEGDDGTGRQRLEDRILFLLFFDIHWTFFFFSSSSQCSVMVNLRLSAKRKERAREREKYDYHRLDRIYVYTCMCILLVCFFFFFRHIHVYIDIQWPCPVASNFIRNHWKVHQNYEIDQIFHFFQFDILF